MTKKVLAIHDMSGFGRCSLTVIIPVISAMGFQVCPVPTALLSAHTGFYGMEFVDTSDYISRCYAHYKSLSLEFEAVYSGFLASDKQIDCCLEFFRGYPAALKVVDPVMGDNGVPYKTYTPELCGRMSELVTVADIITPNLTETAILLGEDYCDSLSTETASDRLKRLCEYSRIAVITGVRMGGEYVNIALDREGGEMLKVCYTHIPANYPGTGDIFTSVLTGALLEGDDLHTALTRATQFVHCAVRATHAAGGEPRNGIMFEPILRDLATRFCDNP
jgi:pyridoxine kinase